jgi:hypothetical protein
MNEKAIAQTPEGWQLVPKEPTKEMLRAGGVLDFGETYKFMLSAAPPAPASEGWRDISSALILETREVLSGLIGQCEARGSLTNFERAEVQLAKNMLERLRDLPAPPAAEPTVAEQQLATK